MKTSVMGPLGLGALAGVGGAAATLAAGWPLIAAFGAYSLFGAGGVVLGGVLNMRLAEMEAEREPAPLRVYART